MYIMQYDKHELVSICYKNQQNTTQSASRVGVVANFGLAACTIDKNGRYTTTLPICSSNLCFVCVL